MIRETFAALWLWALGMLGGAWVVTNGGGWWNVLLAIGIGVVFYLAADWLLKRRRAHA